MDGKSMTTSQQLMNDVVSVNEKETDTSMIMAYGILIADDVFKTVVARGALDSLAAFDLYRIRHPTQCVFVCARAPDIEWHAITVAPIARVLQWTPPQAVQLTMGAAIRSIDAENRLRIQPNTYFVNRVTAAATLMRPARVPLNPVIDPPITPQTPGPVRCTTNDPGDTPRLAAPAPPKRHASDGKDTLSEIAKRELKAEALRLRKLGGFPDTPLGWTTARAMRHLTRAKNKRITAVIDSPPPHSSPPQSALHPVSPMPLQANRQAGSPPATTAASSASVEHSHHPLDDPCEADMEQVTSSDEDSSGDSDSPSDYSS